MADTPNPQDNVQLLERRIGDSPDATEVGGGLLASAASSDETLHACGTILDALGVALVLERGRHLVWANAAFDSMLGYGELETLGKDTEVFYARLEDFALVTEQGRSRMAAGEVYSTELQLKRKNGTLIWCHVTARATDPRDLAKGTFWILQDVTARRESEESLRLSESRLEAAQAQAGIGSWELGPNLEPRYWSKQMYALFGLSPTQGVPSLEEFLRLIHPEDRDTLLATHREAIEGRQPARQTYRSNPEMGPLRHLVATVMPCFDDAGRLVTVTGTAQDVTGVRETEAELRLAQARLEAAQSHAKIGCWEYEPATQRGFWSQEMYHLLGLNPDLRALTTEQWEERIHPDDRNRVIEAYREAVETGEEQSCEYRTNPSNGELRHLCSTYRMVRDGEGKLLHIAGTVQDITERKQAELAVLENEQRLRRLLQNSNDIIAVLDADGAQVTALGPVKAILGYESEELMGHVGAPLIHPDDVGFTDAALARAIAHPGTTFRVEYRARHRSGSWVHLEAVGTSWLHEPSIRGVVLNVRDIGERKRAEQEQARLQAQLQQATKMEAVGRLAGGVAHDFNNLLTVIAGNTELALSELSADSPAVELLSDVSRSAENAASLTHQLLAFSRRQLIEPKVVNLNDSIARLTTMLGRLIGEDVSLELVLSEKLASVLIDPGQLDQVIINLAVNARDAMPHGGRLIIETSNVELDEARCLHLHDLRPNPYVLLTVSDTGQGMSDDVKSRIFEPFFTTKAQGHGTGLGLAMVFGVVKQAGGGIEIDSEVGHGTSFRIFLPREARPVTGLPPSDATIESIRGAETILLVEDNPSVRELTAKMLRRLGYRLTVAKDGEEACRIAAQDGQRIQLLLTDLVMPKMSGRELAEHIRRLHPNTAVLYCSGYSEDTIVRHGLISEHVRFIGKPFSLKELGRKVRQVLDS